MAAVLEEPYLLLCDQKINAATDLVPLLEKLVRLGNHNLVVIADEIGGEALTILVLNKLRGTLNLVAVKAPGFGDQRRAILQDIAILTGGAVVSEEMGRKLESVTFADLVSPFMASALSCGRRWVRDLSDKPAAVSRPASMSLILSKSAGVLALDAAS